MLNDLRHGIRTLFQAKGWTAVVILSLALGIGASTALFSAVNGLLLQKVAVRDPDSLVRLQWAGANDMSTDQSGYGFSAPDASGQQVRSSFSYPMYQQLVADNQTMTDLLACAPASRVNVLVNGVADLATAFVATGNYFKVLGATTRIGRTFSPEDDKPNAAPVAVISHRFWQSRFGGDASVVGRVVQISNVPVTVVGVLSPEFTGIQRAVQEPPDVTLPLAFEAQVMPQLSAQGPRVTLPTWWWLQVVGRTKPGVTSAQVQANLETVFQHTARAGLDSYLSSITDAERATARNQNRRQVPRLRVVSAAHGIYDATDESTRALAILTGVVALMLLIVCANVANLLLSRATMRQKEVSVRLSLGATRGRLVRQLLTESVLLAALGASLGVLIGFWGQRLLPGMLGQAIPVDWRTLAFVIAITGLTAIVFGTAPAMRATGINVNAALKENSRSVVASRGVLTKALLVAQVTISLVLLVGAGLFLRTVQNLRHVDVGFNPQNLVLFRVSPELSGYDEKRTLTLYRDMLDRLRAIPGVQSASLLQPALLSGSESSSSIFVQGRVYPPDVRAGNLRNNIHRVVVSPGFFEAMQMPILVGRAFTDRDHETAPKVVIVNETAARRYFPNENPIGQRFGNSVETTAEWEVVGVLRDAKYNSVRDEAPPTMYLPYLQRRPASPTFAVRTAGEPMTIVPSLREAVREIDANLPVTNVSTQMEQIEQRFEQERLFANAYLLFGGLAQGLAAIGLFGLMSYSVSRRTNEIGIRMALGARRENVLRLILSESMVLVAIGITLGVTIALAAGRLVASQLFGVAATDLVTMSVATLVMVGVATIAGYLPARRASRVDPMVALRDE